MKHRAKYIAVYIVAAVVLASCGGNPLNSKDIDYKSEGTAQGLSRLDVPPDLTAASREERFQVPDVTRTSGTATLSSYNAERSGTPRPGTTYVLPTFEKLRIERSGTQRWLVVPETPEKVWPIVKKFWQDSGFLIKIDLPDAGVMETDWAESRSRIAQGLVRDTIGRVMDGGASSAGERDKYRTRLERGADPTSTEIYISHRGLFEMNANQIENSMVWQSRPSDTEFEAEFLHRLMVCFVVEEARTKAPNESERTPDRAKLQPFSEGIGLLVLDEPFDRSWRRVGLALDRIGFTVEDRDRSTGSYYVRYADPERDAQNAKRNEDFVSRLMFWRSGNMDVKAEQYRIQVGDSKATSGDTSHVQVLDRQGGSDASDAARHILTVLHQQLK